MREIYVSTQPGMRQVAVYERSELRSGQTIDGPAIVEERESTTVIGPGDRLSVNEFGCLVVDVATAATTAGVVDDVPETVTFGSD
jgi:N-methylhydantoinase A/oxoprolinase/acetone carboxylase beta subunit